MCRQPQSGKRQNLVLSETLLFARCRLEVHLVLPLKTAMWSFAVVSRGVTDSIATRLCPDGGDDLQRENSTTSSHHLHLTIHPVVDQDTSNADVDLVWTGKPFEEQPANVANPAQMVVPALASDKVSRTICLSRPSMHLP